MLKVYSPSHVGKKNAAEELRLLKDDQEESEEEKKAQQIDQYIEVCRSMINHPLISNRTRSVCEEGWLELRKDLNVKWMEENARDLPKFIQKVELHYESFSQQLNHAIEHGWLSKDRREEWISRFFDPSLLELDRMQWLTKEFPLYLNNWKTAAEDRTKVLGEVKNKKITSSQIPELTAFCNDDAFLKLHYRDRVGQIAKIRALMIALEKNEHAQMRSTEKMLKKAVDSGLMHASKIGPWMERVANSEDPAAFVATVLTPFIENWRVARADFDRINNALDKDGIPRGFRPVNEKNFLLMDYKQRTSYCALAWAHLEDRDGEHEIDKLLSARKLAIRHCLNTEDWEGAEDLLRKADAVNPKDPELRSMREYLTCHRSESDEKLREPDPKTTTHEMRELLASMHSPQAQKLAMKTLEIGPAAYNRFAQVYGNFGWCVEVARMSEKDLQARSDLQHTTNMDGSILDTKYEGTDKIVADITAHADESAGKTAPNLSGNEYWGYWATLIPDVPFALYREDRQKISKLKYLLRALHATGKQFSVTGDMPDNAKQAA